MGSYLEIDGRETNSKALSGILIDAMRYIDNALMASEKATKKQKGYFKPEYYRTADGETFGCGDWAINKKGMALLVRHLQNIFDDDDALLEIVNKEYSYSLSKITDPDELKETIEKRMKDVENSVRWCVRYTTNILTDMVLYEKKRVDAVWV